MQTRWHHLALVVLACALPGCDLDLGPGLLGPYDIPTTQCLDATAWKLYGLDGDALPVGHSVELLAIPEPSLGVVGCDEAVVAVEWLSTRPEVADLTPGGSLRQAWLTGRDVGETSVSAQITLTDGRTLTAPLGGRLGTSLVQVVEGAPPPQERQVLLEGIVELEPEAQGQLAEARAYLLFEVPAAGSLDMHVDWDSPANDVIPHMCRGETGFPLGCVPIIDGNRSGGVKPVSASTHTTPGPHTLWITNSGPEPEEVRYQVGLIPDSPG